MRKTIILLLLIMQTAMSAFSFDALGHRTVADIAYKNLTDKARKQVDNILGVRGMVYTASWADEIKSDKSYSYSYAWHFQNLADGLSPEIIKNLWENPKSDGLHLFYALDSLTNLLKENGKNEEALKYIVHLVGDCMQPLHLGRLEDLGGNKVYMKWFGKSTNIHAVWDRYLIESTQYSYTEYSQYLCDKFANDKVIKKQTLLESVQKNYLVRQKIYDYQLEGNTNNYNYYYYFKDDLDTSLYTAGVQLAQLLNSIYK